MPRRQPTPRTKKAPKRRQAQPAVEPAPAPADASDSDASEAADSPVSPPPAPKRARVAREEAAAGASAADAAAEQPPTAQRGDDPALHFTTEHGFDDPQLQLSQAMVDTLRTNGFERPTPIQWQAIPPLMQGHDLVGEAKTGSGKTLAFLIPTLELLAQVQWKPRNGTGAIVISPVRELALQIYSVLSELCAGAGGRLAQTHGLIMGGSNRRTEAERLSRGVVVVVATPGRLLDHLSNSRGFLFKNLAILVIDEADHILSVGFEEEMRQIVRLLPRERQTMLFSATQTKKVQDLQRLSMRTGQVRFVRVDEQADAATVAGLEQGYIVCPSEQRFRLLFTFLKRNRKKKVMVFFSSRASTAFHADVLNHVDIPCQSIHGSQKQMKRTSTFHDFCRAERGTLLCTDVAARGLDIPAVDWIVQFDPPDDPRDYIHRVGRTARGAGGRGRALLFLLPSELKFLQYLRKHRVTLNEYEVPPAKVANVQSQYQRLIQTNYHLHDAARQGYRSYVLAYASHSLKNIYDVHQLDLAGVGRSFGFDAPPRVNLNLKASGKNARGGRKNKGTAMHGRSGHVFSADNPYGARARGDTRQFQH